MRTFDTDWLANISIKWVLVAVGILLVLRMSMAPSRLSGRRASDGAAEFMESALIAIVLVFLVIRPFLVQAFYIPSGSMQPTLMVGDRILVNKFIYRVAKPQPGDVVVFVAPNSASPDEKDFIKRIVGLPGDRIEVVPTRVLADGKPVVGLVSQDAGYTAYHSFPRGRQTPRVLNINQRSELPEVTDGGEVVVPRGLSDALRIVPVPRLDVSIEGASVYVNGSHFHTFNGQDTLTEDRDLTAYGAAPSVQGSAIKVNGGEPSIIIVVGKQFSIDPGHVVRNGEPLRERYMAEPPAYAMPEITVPRGEYWVMGDNRNDSNDSHAWGPLRGDRIVGRAQAIFWPLGRIRWVRSN